MLMPGRRRARARNVRPSCSNDASLSAAPSIPRRMSVMVRVAQYARSRPVAGPCEVK